MNDRLTDWQHLTRVTAHEATEDNPPTEEEVQALYVRPYEWGVWCRIEDGKPFVNAIVARRWNADKTQITFMLDTHNFMFAKPDEMMSVVRESYDSWKFLIESRRATEEAFERGEIESSFGG